MKKCSRCNEVKPFSEFHKRKVSKDGYKGVCKVCLSSEIKKQNKEYYQRNKVREKNRIKEYKKQNELKVKEYQKEWYKQNKSHVLEYNLKRYHKLKNDPLFILKKNIRALIRIKLVGNGYTKKSRAHEILGCSFEEFKQHLESKFEDWMNWDNYGNPKDGILEENKTWDIDHIIPISNATSEDEVIKLNHFTNLQPLCSYYNRNAKRDN